jgi:hypothetical protein
LSFECGFTPHALGRDENGGHNVFAFEYGGLTSERPRAWWIACATSTGLKISGAVVLLSGPQFDLMEIEVAVDDNWSRNRQSAAKGAGDSTCNDCEAELTVLVHKRPFFTALAVRHTHRQSDRANVNNKNRAATIRPSTSATRRPLGNLASEFASQQEDCSDAYVGRDQGTLAKIEADPR